jgi:hypothetical protein
MPLRQISFDTDRLRAIFYLLIVPLAVLAILVFAFFNHRSENRHAEQQVEANRKQIVILHNALAEACHATTVQYGVATALILYYASKPDAKQLVDVLGGYATDLSSLSACQGIARP